MTALQPGPLRLEAELDAGLSRWQWLVKSLLVIPHAIALAFLWIAFLVMGPREPVSATEASDVTTPRPAAGLS